MKISSLHRAIVPGIAAVALAATMAACGSSNDNSTATSTDTGGSPAAGGGASGTLTGGGSTAQGSAQVQWATDFQQANSGTTINYNQVGSGTGVTNFSSGTYAFAGSDAYVTAQTDSSSYNAMKSQCGTDPIQVPVYVSPIAIVFHLQGISSLKLDPATIAKIFNGDITTWNDPAIASLNPGVNLPPTQIQPVHRSDDSGTTENFTDYLAKAAGGAWPHKASETWPTTSGLNGNGTSGVVSTAQGTNGSIAYVDFSKSGGFGVVSVKVGSKFVAPSAEGAANDLAASKLDPNATSNQLLYVVDRTSTSPKNYPALLVSYAIACPSYPSASVGSLVNKYLTYVVSEAGQASGAKAAGSAPLPSSISQKATQIISQIK